MPIVLETIPYRFYFFSNETATTPVVTIDKGDCWARFSLNPIKLCKNEGFDVDELKKLEAIMADHEQEFLQKWRGYFGSNTGYSN